MPGKIKQSYNENQDCLKIEGSIRKIQGCQEEIKQRFDKNKDWQKKIEQRYDKNQGCREKLKQRYDKEQGCQEKIKHTYNKINVAKKNVFKLNKGMTKYKIVKKIKDRCDKN